MTTDALPMAEPGAPAPGVATPAWVAGFLLGEVAGHDHDVAGVVLIAERGRLIGVRPLPKADPIV